MFQILSHDQADTVRGWSGANPYGMVQLTLADHVALTWAQSADDYLSAEHRGDYVAHIPLNGDDAEFLELCEAIDASHITTPDHPYPLGTWNSSDPADCTAPNARRGPWAMLVYVDERGWPTYELLTEADAREHFDNLAGEFYDDDADDYPSAEDQRSYGEPG